MGFVGLGAGYSVYDKTENAFFFFLSDLIA